MSPAPSPVRFPVCLHPVRRRRGSILTRLLVGLVVFAAAAAPPARAQQTPELDAAIAAIEAAQTMEEEIDALIEYTRLLNAAGRYAEALDAVSEAAQTINLPAAPEVRADSLPDTSERTRLMLFHRGIAHEGLNQFPEAYNDYRTFLVLEDTSAAAEALAERLDAVGLEATQSLLTLARIDSDELDRFYDPARGRHAVTIFPFHNISETLFLTQIGYGLAGYLGHVLAIVAETNPDTVLRVTDRAHIAAALDEVSLGRFYSETTPIPPDQLARAFGTDFFLSGVVNAGPSGMTVAPRLVSLSRDTLVDLEVRQALTSDPDAVIDLQVTLAYDLVDALETLAGVSFVADSAAFDAAVRALALNDFQRLFAYGRSVELGLIGDFANARSTLEGAEIQIAPREADVLDETQRALETSRTDLAVVQQAAVDRRPDATEPLPGSTTATRTVRRPPPGPFGLTPTDATARMLTLTGQTALGVFGVDDAAAGIPATPTARSRDPRDPVEGALRTQQGQVTIRIVIPVPPPPTTPRTP